MEVVIPPGGILPGGVFGCIETMSHPESGEVAESGVPGRVVYGGVFVQAVVTVDDPTCQPD
jgi:hypothetical protein